MKIFRTILILSTLLSSLVVPVSAQTVGAQTATTEQTYNIFMLVKTTNDWLALSPEARFAFLNSDIRPILQAHPTVEMSFFDTEGFNSRVTDVITWKTSDLKQYQAIIEKLRESKFWGQYFEMVEILPGIENAYANYYQVDPIR
jgi:hypothetical protein